MSHRIPVQTAARGGAPEGIPGTTHAAATLAQSNIAFFRVVLNMRSSVRGRVIGSKLVAIARTTAICNNCVAVLRNCRKAEFMDGDVLCFGPFSDETSDLLRRLYVPLVFDRLVFHLGPTLVSQIHPTPALAEV